jgi:hypothetical protein
LFLFPTCNFAIYFSSFHVPFGSPSWPCLCFPCLFLILSHPTSRVGGMSQQALNSKKWWSDEALT